MPDISPVTRPGPAQIVTHAVLDAVDRHLTVSSKPDLGVHCTSTHAPAWELSPRAEAISPLGAVLLSKQPQVSEPVAALAHVLGVGWMWQQGFDHGCAAEPLNKNHIIGLDRALYADGYAVGAEVRVLLNRIQTRAAELVAEPAKLLPALLSSLLVSEVLGMLAEGQRKRGETLGGAAKEFHERAADDLDALAENFRLDGL